MRGRSRALGALLKKWGATADSARLEHCDAARFLARAAEPMDVVFLDPPFADTTLVAAAAQLEARGWLAPRCLVYLEHPRNAPLAGLPPNWQLLRSGTAGAVGYDLYVRD